MLLVDRVVPDTDAMSFIKLLDLNMLAMTEDGNAAKPSFALCSMLPLQADANHSNNGSAVRP